MSQNTNNNEDKEQIDIPNPEEEDYIPRILSLRIIFRKNVKYFSVYFFILNAFYFIFSICFFNATYMTRNYIFDPDEFWSYNMERPYLLKLQRFCAGAGMYLLCTTIFSIMDNIIIFLHIIKGGLKRRLQYANYIFFFLQLCSFIFCLYGIYIYRNIIILFPFIFGYSIFTLIASIIYFFLINRCIARENLFLLSIERMTKCLKEYKDDYMPKTNKK
jgi:hypothetical protein